MDAKLNITNEEKIYRTFGEELTQWTRTDKTPSMGNQDIRYYLDLQRIRLKHRNLRMEYQMKLRGGATDHMISMTYRDEIYTNMQARCGYLHRTAFYRKQNMLYEKVDNRMLFQTITNMEYERPEETYCCPNCGAISPIQALLDGCPWCQTRFIMSDLFPKVTNYHFEHDILMNEKEIDSKVGRWIFGGILTAFLFFLIPCLRVGGIIGLLVAVFASIPVGAFFGYFIMCIGMMFNVAGHGAKRASMIPNTAGTKKKLNQFMKPLDKNFSYEHFTGKVVNLLKIMIFADNIRNLPVYDGREAIPDFSNIVESVYRGCMGLNRAWIDRGYCYLDLDVYMSDIYDGEKIYQKDDMFRIIVCRKADKKSNLGFSIKKVQCAGCGGSFDATRERRCPYCSNPYYLGEDDWVVLGIQKK